MTSHLNTLYISTCFGPPGSAQQGIWHNSACVDIRERGNLFHKEFTRTCAELKPEDFPDPLFIDPARDNYRLKPESPALRLGFQAIPVDRIGPYADPRRASWPIVEEPGAREAMERVRTPAPGGS